MQSSGNYPNSKTSVYNAVIGPTYTFSSNFAQNESGWALCGSTLPTTATDYPIPEKNASGIPKAISLCIRITYGIASFA